MCWLSQTDRQRRLIGGFWPLRPIHFKGRGLKNHVLIEKYSRIKDDTAKPQEDRRGDRKTPPGTKPKAGTQCFYSLVDIDNILLF